MLIEKYQFVFVEMVIVTDLVDLRKIVRFFRGRIVFQPIFFLILERITTHSINQIPRPKKKNKSGKNPLFLHSNSVFLQTSVMEPFQGYKKIR